MTTITAAVKATLARRDADELAALRAEVARLAPFERAASYWKDNHDREKNAHAGTAASHAALRADLQHALGVRDAAMEAETKAEAERDTLREQLDRCQTKLGERLINDETDALRAQRDAAVEALRWLACPPDPSSNSRMSKYAADALDALLARGTP